LRMAAGVGGEAVLPVVSRFTGIFCRAVTDTWQSTGTQGARRDHWAVGCNAVGIGAGRRPRE